MISKILSNKLFSFLIENKIENKFIKNMRGSSWAFSTGSQAFMYSFDWSETEEGYSFWHRIHEKWQRYDYNYDSTIKIKFIVKDY